MSLLKEQVDLNFVKSLAKQIKLVDPQFSSTHFVRSFEQSDVKQLELKNRIRLLSQLLFDHLEGNFYQKTDCLKEVVKKTSGMGVMVFPEFISMHGISHDLNFCIDSLKYFTPYFSSEFAIRDFIDLNPAKILKIMKTWTKDESHHIRRLACEGCRPRLPWAKKISSLIDDPQVVFKILEDLIDDESLYVRKSVANNLNDISKDHPELVLEFARKWINKSAQSYWICKHGLRTLLKKGDQRALVLFGTKKTDKASVKNLKISPSKISIGSPAILSFDLHITKPVKLRLEYYIYYLKKSSIAQKKIFKFNEKEYSKGVFHLSKKHWFKQLTTRKHYPGEHGLAIVINGFETSKVSFFLI